MLALMNAHQLAAFGEADATADELRTWLTSPSVVPQRDVRLLERDGRLVGYADVDPTDDRPPIWRCDVKIDPEADADDVLGQLNAWLEQRAGEGTLRVWTGADDARLVAAFERLGFSPFRHSFRMEIELDGIRREPIWPPGIGVRTVSDDDDRLVYDVVREVWRDTSDPLHESYEEWQHWTTATAAYDPTLWFLAVDGDDVAGFSLCREDPDDRSSGHVATLGVRRAWRRQGLGEALLLHSFGAFRGRGYRRATLGVDASSPTGALRLYERAGMRVYRDTLFLQKELEA